MFTKGKLMFLYSESLVHAGAGAGVGAVDLPIQRERVSNWPVIHASGVKGAMREHFEIRDCRNDDLFIVFGPDSNKKDSSNHSGNPADNSGAISFSDARILLFTVRSLKGTFAYITCPLALTRLKRDLETLKMLGNDLITDDITQAATMSITGNQILLPSDAAAKDLDSDLAITPRNQKKPQQPQSSSKVVLEELGFEAKPDVKVGNLASWLGDCWKSSNCKALPAPWLNLKRRLAVVSDDVFKDFVEFSTEVITRNKIDDNTGTVMEGALWTEECLPREALLYSLMLACKPRKKDNKIKSDKDVIEYVASQQGKTPERIWVGGDVTVGRGIVRTAFVEKEK